LWYASLQLSRRIVLLTRCNALGPSEVNATDFTVIVLFLQTAVLAVSAFFVWRQLRQVERSIRGNTYQAIANHLHEVDSVFLEHPELQQIFEPLPRIHPSNNQHDIRKDWAVTLVIAHMENVYVQYKEGNLNEDAWSGWKSTITEIFTNDTRFRKLWPEHKRNYSKSFTEFIDGIIDDNLGS
jgi:hypothetical protein